MMGLARAQPLLRASRLRFSCNKDCDCPSSARRMGWSAAIAIPCRVNMLACSDDRLSSQLHCRVRLLIRTAVGRSARLWVSQELNPSYGLRACVSAVIKIVTVHLQPVALYDQQHMAQAKWSGHLLH